jgi:hypothetical protein
MRLLFPKRFVKSLSEISFSPLVVCIQLHLYKWFDKSACPRADVVRLRESVIRCVAVWKQLCSSHRLDKTRHRKWLAINANGKVFKTLITIIFMFKNVVIFRNYFSFCSSGKQDVRKFLTCWSLLLPYDCVKICTTRKSKFIKPSL